MTKSSMDPGVAEAEDDEFEALVAQCTNEEELAELVARFNQQDADAHAELRSELYNEHKAFVLGIKESVLSVRRGTQKHAGRRGKLSPATATLGTPDAVAPQALATGSPPAAPPAPVGSRKRSLTAEEFASLDMAEQEAYLLASIQAMESRRDRVRREQLGAAFGGRTRDYSHGVLGVSDSRKEAAAAAAAEAEAAARAAAETEAAPITDFAAQALADRMDRAMVGDANRRAARAAHGAARAAADFAARAAVAANAQYHDWEIEAAEEARRTQALRGDDAERIQALRAALLENLAASSTLARDVQRATTPGDSSRAQTPAEKRRGGAGPRGGIRVADLYRARAREAPRQAQRQRLQQQQQQQQQLEQQMTLQLGHGHPDRDKQAIYWADEIEQQPWGATREAPRAPGASAGSIAAAAQSGSLPGSRGASTLRGSTRGSVGFAESVAQRPMKSALLHAILGDTGATFAAVAAALPQRSAEDERRTQLLHRRTQARLQSPASFHAYSERRWEESQRMGLRVAQDEPSFARLAAKLRLLSDAEEKSNEVERPQAAAAPRRNWISRTGGGAGEDGRPAVPPPCGVSKQTGGWDGATLSPSSPLKRYNAARRTGKRLISGDVAMRRLCPAAACVGNGHTGAVNWHNH